MNHLFSPILLGKAISSKEYRLDVNACLNNEAILNLEMQILRYSDWNDRSLTYLCRNVDHLHKGEAYRKLKPVIHIGILSHTLFANHPEFYASYMLINQKDRHLYSDKLRLNVLCLNQIQRASEEDQKWGLHSWARLFQATTWEELRMIAEKDPYMSEAANTIFTMNAEDIIRKRCLDRLEYEYDIQTRDDKIRELTSENKGLNAEIERLRAEIEQLRLRS